MTLHEAESHARRVWKSLPGSKKAHELFPRDLVSTLPWAFPITVFMVPDLDTQRVRDWLRQHNIGVSLECSDRRLRGVLIASRGVAAILIDASDTPDERRFTVAHEAAHFFIEYYWPREQALEKLGDGIRAILDGERRPTPAERMNALLRGVTLGVLTHLMDRDPGLQIRSEKVLQSEDGADALAIELIAPYRQVIDEASKHIRSWSDSQAESETRTMLEQQFGLPADVASRYAGRVVASLRSRRTFREWLGRDPGSR